MQEAATAVLFPGQGSQHVGMAVDLVDSSPAARAVFDAARDVLGWDLLAVCRDGPEEELSSTRVSQPAIFAHSMAVLEVLGEPGTFGAALPAIATAGLSLGEYSALVFAGSLRFEEAMALVARRGESMQAACDAEKGAMASILGLSAADVEAAVAAAASSGHRVGVANYNSPAQTVISGEVAGVEAVASALTEVGARKVVFLDVAGAYHSPLMATATAAMRPLLEGATITPPRVPFWSNFFGRQVSDPEEIREGLIRQIEGAVRWDESWRGIIAAGAKEGLELGPKKVLQGLARNIDRSVAVRSIGRSEDLDKS